MKRLGITITLLGGMLLAFAAVSQVAPQDSREREALLLDVRGAIGPATRDFIERAITEAAERNAEIVIIRLDTPGGLDASTRDIVRSILNAPIPVATFVAPAGARAASAGTYILLASHVAAMSPSTHVGAATPVSMIGGSPPETTEPAQDDQGEEGADSNAGAGDGTTDQANDEGSVEAGDEAGDKAGEQNRTAPETSDAMSRKMLNDAVAYIRGLAARHGRNADWAERAVRDADSITSDEALEINVIDFIAADIDALLSEADGRTVALADGEVVLNTRDLTIIEREPDWRTELLAVITDPTIAYILLLIGFYGLVLEGYNPGAIVPGVVGAISLLLALYALQMLPVNYAGLALIVLGIVLIIAETMAPSFGALGIGGVIALVIGSIILMDTEVPGFEVSRTLIGAIALVSSALLFGIVAMAVRAREKPVVAGREHLVGAHGTAAETFDSEGWVYVSGERWAATTDAPVQVEQAVEVTGMDGLTLHVRPIAESHH